MLSHPWLNIDPKLNEEIHKPDITEEDMDNAIFVLKEIVKDHI